MIHVVFVCLGNICRSPMAEAVFNHLLAQEGLSDQFKVASAGTGNWHLGEPAHYGTRQVLAANGVACQGTARRVTRAELEEADYVVAMDRSNAATLRRMASGAALDGRLHLLLDFAAGTQRQDVPDPYYEGNFELVYRLVNDACEGLLAHIRQTEGI